MRDRKLDLEYKEIDEQNAIKLCVKNYFMNRIKKLEDGQTIQPEELMKDVIRAIPEIEGKLGIQKQALEEAIKMLQSQKIIEIDPSGAFRKDEKGNITEREKALAIREEAFKLVTEVIQKTGATKKTQIFDYLKENDLRSYEKYKTSISLLCSMGAIPGLENDKQEIERKKFFNKRDSTSIVRYDEEEEIR